MSHVSSGSHCSQLEKTSHSISDSSSLIYRIRVSIADVRSSDHETSPLLTQALYGERFIATSTLPVKGHWIHGFLIRDGYTGYISFSDLKLCDSEDVEDTHYIVVPRTFVYPIPSIKSPPVLALPLGATIHIDGRREEKGQIFLHLSTGGFVFAPHCMPCDIHTRDFVEVAKNLLYTPYLWGGKSSLGIDCSGLVQVAAYVAGHCVPRDSKPQLEHLGIEKNPFDLHNLQRGDLIFWPGHVGIMLDGG